MAREKRLYRRYAVSRRGELSDQSSRFPCLIQDVSPKGFFIICTRDLAVGQELGLTFELNPEQYHQSKIQVQHINDGCLGSQITEISEPDYQAFQQFVRQRASN